MILDLAFLPVKQRRALGRNLKIAYWLRQPIGTSTWVHLVVYRAMNWLNAEGDLELFERSRHPRSFAAMWFDCLSPQNPEARAVPVFGRNRVLV